MASKKEKQLSDALDAEYVRTEKWRNHCESLEGQISEGNAAFERLAQRADAKHDQVLRLQATIAELNRRNNRLHDYVIKSIEHG